MRILGIFGVLLLIVVILFCVFVIWGVIQGARKRRRATSARWERQITAGDEKIYVTLHRLDQTVQVAKLDPNDPDFDVQLYEAEAKADDMASTFNAGDE